MQSASLHNAGIAGIATLFLSRHVEIESGRKYVARDRLSSRFRRSCSNYAPAIAPPRSREKGEGQAELALCHRALFPRFSIARRRSRSFTTPPIIGVK